MNFGYIWCKWLNTNENNDSDYFPEHMKISLFEISPRTRHIASHIGCLEVWYPVNVMAKTQIKQLPKQGIPVIIYYTHDFDYR